MDHIACHIPFPAVPSLSLQDGSLAANVTDRLTDTSKYTGAHKHRFDASGHGLGIAGRELPAKGQGMSPGSVAGQAGYVQGYRNEGSYGRKWLKRPLLKGLLTCT